MSEELTVLGVSFVHNGPDSALEITHGEDRDQAENAGIIKTSSAKMNASSAIEEACAEGLEILERLVGLIYLQVHAPAPTRPSGRRRELDAPASTRPSAIYGLDDDDED